MLKCCLWKVNMMENYLHVIAKLVNLLNDTFWFKRMFLCVGELNYEPQRHFSLFIVDLIIISDIWSNPPDLIIIISHIWSNPPYTWSHHHHQESSRTPSPSTFSQLRDWGNFGKFQSLVYKKQPFSLYLLERTREYQTWLKNLATGSFAKLWRERLWMPRLLVEAE